MPRATRITIIEVHNNFFWETMKSKRKINKLEVEVTHFNI